MNKKKDPPANPENPKPQEKQNGGPLVLAIIPVVGVLGAALITGIFALYNSRPSERDVITDTNQDDIHIVDDLVYVHFDKYSEQPDSEATLSKSDPEKDNTESYTDPLTNLTKNIYDKTIYVEYVSLKKTNKKYQIHLSTTGITPQIVNLDVPSAEIKPYKDDQGRTRIDADLDISQYERQSTHLTQPNPKAIYVFRNGYQKNNSSGGKQVRYKTDKLTLVYDFSSLISTDEDAVKRFKERPQACVQKESDKTHFTPLNVTWTDNGVAIANAYNLDVNDQVEMFWTWARDDIKNQQYQRLTCEMALR